jgi:hypothetical protein
MKFQFSACAVLLAALSPVSAQLATSSLPSDPASAACEPALRKISRGMASRPMAATR